MLKNRNIICISSIDWDFIWQGQQEIMSTYAKNGNRVLFIDNMGTRSPTLQDLSRIKKRIKNWFKGIKGIRKVRDNLYIFSPLVFPFPYSRLFRKINRMILSPVIKAWIKVFNFDSPITWVFLPTYMSIELLNILNSEIVIYYCVDRFVYSSNLAKRIKKSEKCLIGLSDFVFASTQSLANDLLPFHSNVKVFNFGVNINEFESVRDSSIQIPSDIRNIKHPVIGYIGGIHKWIDIKLIKYIAESFPTYSIVFVGPIQTDVSILLGIKNIYFLNQKEYSQVPLYIKSFDIGIIPYLLTDYTAVGKPTKLNEYLIMGKPVVSTDMPEVAVLSKQYPDTIMIAQSKEEFVENITKSIALNREAIRQERIKIAEKNSWEKTIEEMSTIINKSIEEKEKEKEIKWQDVFYQFYRSVEKRLMRFVAITLIAYFILFYTPLVFWLARPLKISNIPKKSDAIVVFAGGVGESGKAGQGYEERVQYAIELYKKGYAKNLIFSSGYMYVFKEPLVMKTLAVSFGIPEENITLEDKARNTYENVKFTKEILKQNNWNEILLVSSPYHMRRASLIFNKIAKDINVVYTPIPNSLFYSHPDKDIYGRRIWKRINLKQIKGILHEYLGIVYYWWKRWI